MNDESMSKRAFIKGGAVAAGCATLANLGGCGGASAAPGLTLEELATRLDTMESESRIRFKLATYARAFDRLDLALAQTIYAPEATVDYGTNPDTGQTIFKGSGAQAVEWLYKVDKSIAARGSLYLHYQNQAFIRIQGDTAASEVYGGSIVMTEGQDGAPNSVSYGLARYLDQWVRRNGDWLIVKRVVTSDGGWRLTTNNPISPTYNFAMDRSDPSYAVLGSVNP